jgi:hypothetical protein
MQNVNNITCEYSPSALLYKVLQPCLTQVGLGFKKQLITLVILNSIGPIALGARLLEILAVSSAFKWETNLRHPKGYLAFYEQVNLWLWSEELFTIY